MEEIATFAAGCFWGVEKAFSAVNGVTNTEVGYTGGKSDMPTYDDVCGGGTGHAEAIRITFDPSAVSYESLLDVFWETHDPTPRDRVKFDVDGQYRSAIFYHNDSQKQAALKSRRDLELSGTYSERITTQVTPAGNWWPAEEYHQQYLKKLAERKPEILRG